MTNPSQHQPETLGLWKPLASPSGGLAQCHDVCPGHPPHTHSRELWDFEVIKMAGVKGMKGGGGARRTLTRNFFSGNQNQISK